MDKFLYRKMFNDVLLILFTRIHAFILDFYSKKHAIAHFGRCQSFFMVEKISLLERPTQSLNLIIIETCEYEPERRCRVLLSAKKTENLSQLQQKWSELPFETLAIFIDPFYRGYQAVIHFKCFPTEYLVCLLIFVSKKAFSSWLNMGFHQLYFF